MIRVAAHADLPACLLISAVPEFTSLHGSREARTAYLQSYLDGGLFLVAVHDGNIVGLLIAEPMLSGTWWVDGIAVSPAYRGQGIGKQLFSDCRRRLRARGAHRLYLMAPASRSAPDFYRSIGLREGERFIEFTDDLSGTG